MTYPQQILLVLKSRSILKNMHERKTKTLACDCVEKQAYIKNIRNKIKQKKFLVEKQAYIKNIRNKIKQKKFLIGNSTELLGKSRATRHTRLSD
jgi:hypothetical protein